MTKISEIKKHVQELVGFKPNLPFSATVKSIEGNTCTVSVSESLDIPNVKLRSTDNNVSDYLLITPKQGSKVTVLSLTGTIENLSVIKVDEVEKITYSKGDLFFLVDGSDGKVSIKNKDTSMLSAILDLTKLLKKDFKVYTSVGASGTALPDTVTKLNTIEATFKKFLK